MDSRDYTADAITRSMGIGAFSPHWSERRALLQIRALFCPSFHPELCITIEPAAAGLRIDVVVAQTQIWGLPQPGPVTTSAASATIPNGEIETLQDGFVQSLADRSEAVVMLDGMPIHISSRAYNRSVEANDNPASGAPLAAYAAKLVSLAYDAIDNPHCRNALSSVGAYVGLALEKVEIAESDKPLTRITVPGVTEEQEEFLAAIEAVMVSKDRDGSEV